MKLTIPFCLAMAVAVSPVLTAPLPEAASALAAIIEGLPKCARPAMTAILASAPMYDCAKDNGAPDLACACLSRPFKSDAKRRVSKACPEPADISASRKWAVARCTDALASVRPSQGKFRFLSNTTSGKSNVTAALPVPLFDIDDDEDETAVGSLFRPAAASSLLVAVGAAVLML